jgi:predicted phosphodiesterase
MRIALISDIHGNFVSLTAVLAHIYQANVDQIICLGDVATMGPQPREVVDCLMAFDCPCLMGNHDAFLLNPSLAASYMPLPWFDDVVAWTVRQLSAAQIDYIRHFPSQYHLPLADGQELLCFHGSPDSYFTNILATTSSADLDRLFNDHRTTIMAGGHTHVQMLRQHLGIWVLNVGSVGMPFEQMPFVGAPRFLPWAEYTIVQVVNGVLSVEMHRVPVDVAQVKEAAYASSLPHPQQWAENWLLSWQP